MEFRQKTDELNFIDEQFATEPVVNVISKEQFEERIYKVFTILWEKLSKSFGPGGAGTFISIYPAYYNTKDGYTIMKNIAFDKKLDQVISDIAMTICNRLNYTVGDGTTTAIIATKSIYEAYIRHRDFFESNNILPRDILAAFEKFKANLLEELDKMATPIRSNDPAELRKNIEKVVYISSNGNEEITNMIASLYEQLMYPAISCVLSQDGTMRSSIVEGYKTDICLTDKIYINNDNNTMALSAGADVIMFDHKITRETYEKILKPLSDACKGRNRHLICIAPFYDEMALNGVIKSDLNIEYRNEHNINLVLMVCAKATGAARVNLEDLAMLLNTQMISPQMETEFIEILSNGENVYKLFDMDNRGIEGITVCTVDSTGSTLIPTQYHEGLENVFNYFDESKGIRLGYADKLDLGLKLSTFSGFYYDEALYTKTMNVAKSELEEIQKKCEKIGTFSTELINKQKRVYSLGLKTGIIEVGSDTELSQGYLKDTVDDAVKAAASAYNNGVLLGCNVSLLKAINTLYNESENDIDKELLSILMDGFMSVYMTVLNNIHDSNVNVNCKTLIDELHKFGIHNISDNFLNYCYEKFDESDFTLAKAIIDYSITTNQVLDLGTGIFNSNVINSAETDKEILKATIDLLSLIITGNQLVLR